MISGNAANEISTVMEHDTVGRITKLYQAFGEPEQKVTAFGYNTSGIKDRVIKFDGTVIDYTHDVLGRVSTMTSSDASIDYEYTYDLNDNVTSIFDKVNGTSTTKEYDCYNYLIKETLGNGQSVTYTNDLHGRMLQVNLSDDSAIGYEYDGSRLVRVFRIDGTGSSSYSHSYDVYDFTGKVFVISFKG